MKSIAGVVGGLIVGAAVGSGLVSYVLKRSPQKPYVLEVGSIRYKAEDLPSTTRSALYDVEFEAYERVQNILSQYAFHKVLAEEKGQAKGSTLPALETLIDVPVPTEEEMKLVYDQNKDRLAPGTTYEAIKKDIETHLKNVKLNEETRKIRDTMKEKGRWTVLFPVPESPQYAIDFSIYPSKGPQNPSKVLVEVADYLCPHCQMSYKEVHSIWEEKSKEVRLTVVPFTFRPEGLGGTLARGAFCAKEQSLERFWAYHEKAFAKAQEKGWRVQDPDEAQKALEIGREAALESEAFEKCLNGEVAKSYVKKMNELMVQGGVTATPTFFVNQRKVNYAGKALREALGAALK